MKRKLLIPIFVLLLLVVSVLASTLTIQKADFVSNDPELRTQAWLLSIVSNERSDYWVGTFSSDEIEDDEKKALHDLKVESTVTDKECSYNVQQGGVPIYKLDEVFGGKWVFSWRVDDEAEACESRSDSYFFHTDDRFTGNYVYCFTKKQDAEYGFLVKDAYNFKNRIKVTIDNEVESMVVSNKVPEAQIGDRVYARWQGNLGSGVNCPDPNDKDIRSAHTSVGWRLIDKKNYEAYKTHYDVGFKSCLLDDWARFGIADADSCMEDFNDKSDVAQSRASFSHEGESLAIGSDGVARIKVKPLEFPVISMRINADWLGVFLPVGMPKITSISSGVFEEGKEGFITVDVQNVGSVDASFSTITKCNFPFESTGTSIIKKVREGSIETFKIPISATTNEAEFGSTCVVRVQDVQKTSNYDQTTVEVTVKNAPICTSGDVKCEGSTIYRCNDAGNWDVKKVCENVCDSKIEEGRQVVFCKTEEGGEEDKFREGGLDVEFWWVAGGVIGLLAFAFFGLLANKYIRKNFEPKYGWIGFVIGGVVGLFLAYSVILFQDVLEMLLLILAIAFVLGLILWFTIGRKSAKIKRLVS